LRKCETDLRGQPWRNLFSDGGDPKPQPMVRMLDKSDGANEPNPTARTRLSLRERPQVTLDVISTLVELEGKPAGYVHILRDATAEEQLVRSQDEFIMNAAHELRGPLASLRASIELLVEDHAVMPRQEMGVMLRTMQRAVVKFQGLVENILDIGNVQAGRFRVRPAPTPLDNVIADALSQVGPLLTGRAQRAQVRMECPPPCMVLADRPRVIQVLINLITNASKYGPEGEIIDLHVFPKDQFVIVEVNDRGPGIAPEEQANIFQRFYRGRQAEDEGIGIGLGLALAREIVTAHGGQIDVTSKVGEGTTFWFSLPRVDRGQ
jgi:signal transduction histidine kinase